MKNFLGILFVVFLFSSSNTYGGTEGGEELKKSSADYTVNECFEGTSRAIFAFNQGLDKVLFKPIAKGYRTLPLGLRKGTSNFVGNLRSLLTFSNNVLQGDFRGAGNTAGRFVINSTVGILGVFDPASHMGLEKKDREDFGQTLGYWGSGSSCYFVLPVLGPTTTRDAVGLVGNVFLDPVYHITHNSEVLNRSYSEHNYYYYRGTDSVDFRAKNIESFDSLEKNSMDLYASFKSLYLQDRNKKIANSDTIIDTQNDSDWEEIDSN